MKKIIAIFACVVILCSCLVIPSFAVNYSGGTVSNTSVSYLLNGTAQDVYQANLVIAKSNTNDTFLALYRSNDNSFEYIPVIVNYQLVIISNVACEVGNVWRNLSNNNQGQNYILSVDTFDNDTSLYYGTSSYGVEQTATVYAESFTDLDDALSYASNNFVINHNSFDVPAGNVAYIKTNGSKTIDLSTTFIQYSQLFSNTWANITQKVTSTSSLPVGSVTFPLSGMETLDWTKTGNTNVLGQTQNASASYQTVANQYFVIYNPLYQQYGQGDNYDMNGTIHVSGDLAEIKVYPLSGSVVTGQGLVSNSESDYSDFFELQDDGNGGFEWVDQNGNISSGPQTGGTSLLPQEATIQTLASQILQIITKVGQSIANIFNVGHQAIVTLVGHASTFVTHFQSLYTWLPADIFAVLSSAIILAITIGIIKVFI